METGDFGIAMAAPVYAAPVGVGAPAGVYDGGYVAGHYGVASHVPGAAAGRTVQAGRYYAPAQVAALAAPQHAPAVAPPAVPAHGVAGGGHGAHYSAAPAGAAAPYAGVAYAAAPAAAQAAPAAVVTTTYSTGAGDRYGGEPSPKARKGGRVGEPDEHQAGGYTAQQRKRAARRSTSPRGAAVPARSPIAARPAPTGQQPDSSRDVDADHRVVPRERRHRAAAGGPARRGGAEETGAVARAAGASVMDSARERRGESSAVEGGNGGSGEREAGVTDRSSEYSGSPGRNEYRQHTLEDYKHLMEKVALERRPAGLGPVRNEEWAARKAKTDKARAFAERLRKLNRQRLARQSAMGHHADGYSRQPQAAQQHESRRSTVKYGRRKPQPTSPQRRIASESNLQGRAQRERERKAALRDAGRATSAHPYSAAQAEAKPARHGAGGRSSGYGYARGDHSPGKIRMHSGVRSGAFAVGGGDAAPARARGYIDDVTDTADDGGDALVSRRRRPTPVDGTVHSPTAAHARPRASDVSDEPFEPRQQPGAGNEAGHAGGRGSALSKFDEMFGEVGDGGGAYYGAAAQSLERAAPAAAHVPVVVDHSGRPPRGPAAAAAPARMADAYGSRFDADAADDDLFFGVAHNGASSRRSSAAGAAGNDGFRSVLDLHDPLARKPAAQQQELRREAPARSRGPGPRGVGELGATPPRNAPMAQSEIDAIRAEFGI